MYSETTSGENLGSELEITRGPGVQTGTNVSCLLPSRFDEHMLKSLSISKFQKKDSNSRHGISFVTTLNEL